MNMYVTHLCPFDPKVPPTDNVATNHILVTHIIDTQFRTREFKRITLSIIGKCNDMEYYHNPGINNIFEVLVIACAERNTNLNQNLQVFFYDPAKDSITSLRRAISGTVKFTSPIIRFGLFTTTLGINRPYAVILDELNRSVYSAFKTTLTSQTYTSNRDIIFVDLAARTISALSFVGTVDLDMVIDIVCKENRIFLAGYKQLNSLLTSREARIFECPISSSLTSTTCTRKSTGFVMSAGAMRLAVDSQGNDDRLYFYEDS